MINNPRAQKPANWETVVLKNCGVELCIKKHKKSIYKLDKHGKPVKDGKTKIVDDTKTYYVLRANNIDAQLTEAQMDSLLACNNVKKVNDREYKIELQYGLRDVRLFIN